jgi:hypothetical protein
MNKFIILFIFCFLSHTIAEAVLPPLWNSVREIQAILKDEQLGHFLTSADLIEEIRKEGDGYYILGSQHACRVQVIYTPLPQGMVGPSPFHLVFSTTDKFLN